jgi:hypothetical protein
MTLSSFSLKRQNNDSGSRWQQLMAFAFWACQKSARTENAFQDETEWNCH